MPTSINSSRLINLSKKRKNLWENDSQTDLSSTSDHDNIQLTNENHLSTKHSCLICSIQSSLSNTNCCEQHLTLLTTESSSSMICRTSPQVKNGSRLKERSPCLKSKYKHRHRSPSMLSATSRYWRERKSLALKSFNTTDIDDLLLSPNEERSPSSSIRSQRNRANHLSTMNYDKNNNYIPRISSSPLTTPRKRRISVVENQSRNTRSTSIQSDAPSLWSPRIILQRVIHVKDENEELIIPYPQITLNMSQATKQMTAQSHAQPKIFLKRVCFEQ